MSNFPAELDELLTTPGAGESLGGSSPTHPEHHTELEARTRAIQLAVGKSGSADTASIEYRLAGVIAAADAAASAAADAAADAISALANAALASSDLADHEADTGAHDIAATVATAIAAHESALDPHGVYPLEADLGTAAFLDAGTAVGDLVQVQAGGALPALDASALLNLPASGVTDHGALTGLADDDHGHYHTDARGDARYAPIAKGVTNGDSHNHDGGDGAQIAYASLSGLPTLGSAAAAGTGDFEASGTVSTHNAAPGAHGATVTGAAVLTAASQSAGRTALGLGTAATTASTAYEAAGAVSAHAGGTGVHTIAGVTGLQGALDAKAPTDSPTFTGPVNGITAAMVGAPTGSGTSTGVNTGDSATPAETRDTIGALINGATSKTPPVDADKFSIWDSVSGLMQSLSVSALKTSFLSGSRFGSDAQQAGPTGLRNVAFGLSAQYALTTGSNNSATGAYAQQHLTTGSNNSATGAYAQQYLTAGSNNSATGAYAQRYLTTGSNNSATGAYAQLYLTTGSNNSATGAYAQQHLTTGLNNSATGYVAQQYLADGVTVATVFSNCTHIGDGTRVSANSVTNETAIGSGVIGLGSNTCALGNSSVTRTGLRGSVEVIAASSTTIAQSQAGVSASWVDSTHATRKARGILTAWDYSGGREAFRFEADGTQIKTSVNGVAAVARAAALTAEIPGDATRDELRLTELYNACKNFGIIN